MTRLVHAHHISVEVATRVLAVPPPQPSLQAEGAGQDWGTATATMIALSPHSGNGRPLVSGAKGSVNNAIRKMAHIVIAA